MAAAAPRRRRQGPGGDGAAAAPEAAGGEAPSPLFTVCPYILGNELCERLAYYGLCTNLVVYFTTVVGFSTSDANAQVNYWSGVCYCTPLLGAFLSDTVSTGRAGGRGRRTDPKQTVPRPLQNNLPVQ